MIQRIQTLWILLSALSSGFLMKGGIVNFIDQSGQKFYTGLSGLYKIGNAGPEIIRYSVSLEALIILIPVMSVITIFLFKKRNLQKISGLLLVSLSLISAIVITFYSYLLSKNYNAGLVIGFKMFLPLIILIASTLAYRGISRDDNLIKSYDRLR